MIARLLISPILESRIEEIRKLLMANNLYLNHPDLLYLSFDSKLGIAEARKIKQHFSLKPYLAKGRAVVLEDASLLTHEAQSALLKIIEEPPKESLILLGAPSDSKLLPTILSRCQIINIKNKISKIKNKYDSEIEKLNNSSTQERFEYIEKLKNKEEFLKATTAYFHQNRNMDFLKELLQAEEWAGQNVNLRAILEYLMLVMPSKM